MFMQTMRHFVKLIHKGVGVCVCVCVCGGANVVGVVACGGVW